MVDINENGPAELTRDLRITEGMYFPDAYITYPIGEIIASKIVCTVDYAGYMIQISCE